jgi:hypothetical protein
MLFLGVDPGVTGALAEINTDDQKVLVMVWDTPVLHVKSSKKTKTEYSVIEMARMLSPYAHPLTGVIAAIESVHAMPEQGVSSSFSFGRGLGLWEGILSAFKIPFVKITPQRWKGSMLDGMGKEKDASRLRAQALFPNVDLSLKKHHGRGDALLIAEYLRKTYRPNWEGGEK